MLKLVATMKKFDDMILPDEELELVFGDSEAEWDSAWETLIIWSDWMAKGIDSLLEFENKHSGVCHYAKPCYVESISMVYTAGPA